MALYIPERQHIVWLDFEPTKGREIGKYRPALVLSSKEYNKKTGMLICCPISTSIRGSLTEVVITTLDQRSVVVTTHIHTLDWRERKVKKIAPATDEEYAQVMVRLLPLIGALDVIQAITGSKLI
ncbi:MAG: mRNA interferase [Halothiobacillaceae bacterium]|nr:MAG: mRNA interferase [Halothiobacillaceae bacterium]